MEKSFARHAAISLLCVALLLFPQSGVAEAVGKEGYTHKVFPVLSLPMPQREAEKAYLGLSGSGDFKIGQIKAPILIIEIFSFYCPHCQIMAALVNEFYQKIQERPGMKEKIKMIGIGASNSAYEVDSFKERYQVPFPLFPDESLEIAQMLGVRGTPTFIGIKINGDGTQEQFYSREGGFEDVQQFLAEIIKLSGQK